MAEEKKQSVIQKIDSALAKYYEDCGRNDFNSEGIGKFEAFCKDNGFEDDDILDELNAKPDECMLVEFDKDDDDINHFPLKDSVKNEEEAIYNILKYINENGVAPSSTKLEPKSQSKLPVMLDISEEEVEEIIEQIYQKQLSCFKEGKAREPDLMYFFAVGHSNKMPFLTWMVDAFTLDKTKEYVETQKVSTVRRWATQNQFMVDITAKHPEKAKRLQEAMISYGYRIMPRLQYTPTINIDDNIKDIVDYICGVPAFIKGIIKRSDDAKIKPFCIDVSFAVNVNQQIIQMIGYDEIGDYKDDDDDDDDDEIADHIGDHISDLKIKLQANKLISDTQNFPNKLDDDEDDKENKEDDTLHGYSRLLMNSYNSFRSKLNENKKKDKHDPASFPRNKRFGIFIDRRKIKENNKSFEVTFFEQLDSCSNIPNDHVAEWYMDATRQCIIPGTGDKHIKATDNVCGQLITFSFHVEAVDEMKCYIIWNGQTMRFKGDNLGNILSYLFVDSKDVKNIRDKLAQFDQQLTDHRFDDFYERINNGYMIDLDI